MTAKKRREPAVNWLIFTDMQSVFVDFAVRHIGGGVHGALGDRGAPNNVGGDRRLCRAALQLVHGAADGPPGV